MNSIQKLGKHKFDYECTRQFNTRVDIKFYVNSGNQIIAPDCSTHQTAHSHK